MLPDWLSVCSVFFLNFVSPVPAGFILIFISLSSVTGWNDGKLLVFFAFRTDFWQSLELKTIDLQYIAQNGQYPAGNLNTSEHKK